MDVSGQNFWSLIPTILDDVQNALFVAFDLELSGIPTRQSHRSPQEPGLPTLEARYAETKRAAEKFHILQLGLTFVLADSAAPGSFVLKSYNIFVNPLPQDRMWVEREFTFHSSAVKFLRQQNFNLDAPLILGVPYLSRTEESISRQRWEDYKSSAEFTLDTILRNEDQPSIAFMQQVRDDIDAWIDDKTPSKPDYVNIAPSGFESDPHAKGLSSFQRRLVHQLTQREYPQLKTVSRPGGFVQILDRNDEKGKEAQEARNESYERRLTIAGGLRWPIEALARGDLSAVSSKVIPAPRDDLGPTREAFDVLRNVLREKKTILVGHNVFMDLMFLYAGFFQPLPPTVSEFSEEISKSFPNIVDTKYLATHHSLNVSLEKSSLEELSHQLRHMSSPRIVIHPDHARYMVHKPLHEAGYDSMLTATIMIRLSAKLQSEGKWVDVRPLHISDDEAYLTPPEEVTGVLLLPNLPTQAVNQTGQRGCEDKDRVTLPLGKLPFQNKTQHLEHASSLLQKPSKGKTKSQNPRSDSKHQPLPRTQGESRVRGAPRKASPPLEISARMEPATPPFIPTSEKEIIQAQIDQITGYTQHAYKASPSVPNPPLSYSHSFEPRPESLAYRSHEAQKGKGSDDLIAFSSPTEPLIEALPMNSSDDIGSECCDTADDVAAEDQDGNKHGRKKDKEEIEGDEREGVVIVTSNAQKPTMPAFNSHFWEVYGNKLRVNGTQEGVCKLHTWHWE